MCPFSNEWLQYRITHFHQLRNTVYICSLQRNYDSKCKTLTRMNFLRCNTHDMTRRKNFVFLLVLPLIYDTLAFRRRNGHMLSIHLNKHNINYLKRKSVDSMKVIDISFTRTTHFNQLTNIEYLCRLQWNYVSECKKLIRMILVCNTQDLTGKKIWFFYLHNPWNMILSPFLR
jgi:hypothetical protein